MNEAGYKFLDRMVEYTIRSSEYTTLGNMYQRLLIANILSLNLIGDIKADYAKSLIRAAQMRVLDGDMYNVIILISTAITCMGEADNAR